MSASQDAVDRAFRVSLWLKGGDGVLELLGGFLLLIVPPDALSAFVAQVTRHELSEDPHDVIANFLLGQASSLTRSTTLFGALYLISHGLIKLVLVVAVLREKLWAYPWMIAFLIVFIFYQVYRLILKPSVWLVGLTVFDIVVVILTRIEYRRLRATPVGGT